ncbi:hypothetical protein C8R46DRAFT_1191754 [Mycena filopes]|nr:hypothetical protein C8R46DRAFT_1191754 [Mycena filopes]
MPTTADLRRRLVELDAEIIEQEAVLDTLERNRLAVQQELEDTSTFPVLTLPVEITTEIFIWCLPTIEELRAHHALRSDGKPAEPLAPLSLASCCRLWRAIALATPSLWTTLPLFFRDDSITTSGREDLAEFIDRWLDRAAAISPLTFVFHIPPLPYSSYHLYVRTSLHCVRDALRRCAQTLEHLDLTANVFDLSSLLNLYPIDFPLLQRIVIGIDDEDNQHPHPCPKSFEAPQFSELSLRDSALLSSYTLPLTQLTRFEGGMDDLQLFQLAPNLIEAKCCFYFSERTPSRRIITHPGLRFLTLSFYDNPNFEYILGQLTLPALLSLDLHDGSPTDAAALQSLFRRSNPPLKSLALQVNIDDPWDDVEDPFDLHNVCFSLVAATLENLDIYSPSPTFISSLWHMGSENADYHSLPQLLSLALINCPPVDYQVVLAFLYQRSTSPALATLESFQLQYSDGIVLDDERITVREASGTPRTIAGHVRELESNGTRIQIGSSTHDLF